MRGVIARNKGIAGDDSNPDLPGKSTPLRHSPNDDLEKLLAPSRVLPIREYADLLRDVPIPTTLQRLNFVEYVTTAHSWYKHLPRYLPGAPFYIFINRFAGCRWQAGWFVEKEKPEEHYSDLATAEYRARFGFLSYCACDDEGIRLLECQRTAGLWEELAANLGALAQLSAVPQPVLQAGLVRLTAAIHPLSQSYDYWDAFSTGAQVNWPDESGGGTTLKRLCECCAEMRKPEYNLEENRKKREEALNHLKLKGEIGDMDSWGIDPVLHELLEPERERQKNEMLKAIDRVLMQIHET